MSRSIRKVAALASMLAALLTGGAHAAERPAAATVMLLAGEANASDAQTMAMRMLAKGDKLYPGEIISSGANTYVNLRFNDGGFILLRPNTRFVIEEFAADAETLKAAATAAKAAPAPATAAAAATPAPLRPIPNARAPSAPTAQRAFFRLLKGGFRAVSGLIGKADQAEYRVNTPVATIGIRGTDYWVVLCDARCADELAGSGSGGNGGAGGMLFGQGGSGGDGGAGGNAGSGPAGQGGNGGSGGMLFGQGGKGGAGGNGGNAGSGPAGHGGNGGLPEGVSGLNGVIMGVISGGIFTTNAAGVSVDVNVNQFLITLPDGTQIFLPVAPEFLRLDPIPDPTTICDQDV